MENFFDDYAVIAKDVLETVQRTYIPRHEFALANIEEFRTLDINFYNQLQSKLEQLGFELLCDVEDITVSTVNGIKTVVRAMRHSGVECLAVFYYVPQLAVGIYEFETIYADGNAVVSTIAPEEVEITRFPLIQTLYYDFDTEIEQLYMNHVESIKQLRVGVQDNEVMQVSSFDELVAAQNVMNRHRHEHLKEIGWVTRDYLKTQSNGNEDLASRVYEEIQKLNC